MSSFINNCTFPSVTEASPSQRETLQKTIPSSMVQKINRNLYSARRAEDNDLTFVLSRLTDDNLALWSRLVGKWGSRRGSEVVKELWDEHCEKNWASHQKRFYTEGIEAGAMAFRNTLELYKASQGKAIRPEIWISYVLSGKDIDPSKPMHEGLFPSVEMVLTALTHPDVPIVLHLGIGRTAHHTKSVYNGILSQHKGLAIPLHSFTAKAILESSETSQKCTKIWMHTRPTFSMANILDHSLPKEAVLKGKELIPIIHNPDGSISIKNREGQVVFVLTKEECASGKVEFFNHAEMHQPLAEYSVEYRVLADSF